MYNNIPLLIKYYKEGKISEFTLCSELSDILSDENYANIILTKDTVSATTNSFVAALMPEKGNNGLKVNYVIDKKAVASDIVTDEDVANCLLALKTNAQNILAAYIKELNQVKMVDFALSDAVLIYSKIFRMSVNSFSEEFKAKAKEINLIKYDEIDDAITKMQTDISNVNQVIECLLVNDLIPDVFIDTAKEMVTNQTKTRITIGDALPSTNIMQSKFNHTPEEDDIFSGGVQIKEKLNESNHETIFKGNVKKFNNKPSKKIKEYNDEYKPKGHPVKKDKTNKHKKNLAQYDYAEDEDYVDYKIHEEATFTLDLKEKKE